MAEQYLPLGKLPPELLASIISRAPIDDDRVILGPGIGFDCAVVDVGPNLLVMKSDPITFATDEIGWYAVQVNANDIATTGAAPRWFMATVLLPEGGTTEELVHRVSDQLFEACRDLGISMIGGHTEVTYGLDRPLVIGTMIGEVEHSKLVTPRGASSGDHVLLTKGIPIEATAILAREFPDRLRSVLDAEELLLAADFLHNPGISVSRDAQIACSAGRVTAMHDPTEGGLAAAIWEMAEASGLSFCIVIDRVHIPALSGKICKVFDMDPLGAIASGALLLTAPPQDGALIQKALHAAGIPCTAIGWIEDGPAAVWELRGADRVPLQRPARDEITKAYE
ncbi:MAG: AIR synthase family protein [Anaerolineaceae bacterium]|nr:AIR synthase family protein [Anaerolineaceae bacterium]